MTGRGFCVKVELELHAVTCPGVWLCPNGKIAVQINTLGFAIESHRILPVFPLLFHDKFIFKKIFTGITTLIELQRSLEQEHFCAELTQWITPRSHGVTLATFETSLVDLLYPAPPFKGLLAGVSVDLLMEPTTRFPGILAPKIEISTRTIVEEVLGISKKNMDGAHVINPKVINSKNTSCVSRKIPSKGIIRQRKVCHSHGKVNKCQVHRPNHQKTCATESIEPRPLYCSNAVFEPAQTEECYHKIGDRSKSSSLLCLCDRVKSEELFTCEDTHIFDKCPVCLKYTCYFSGWCDKFDTVERKSSKCRNGSLKVSEPSERVRALPSETIRASSSCICRPNSAPIERDDKDEATLSELRAKIRQLQKAKEKLAREHSRNYINDFRSCVHEESKGKHGFYKDLEKFYKRMYKQAKMRAREVECT